MSEVNDRHFPRIGYWLAEKKIRKLNFEDFEILCWNSGLDIIKLDLDESFEEQGPFDLIFHKLTDQISRSELGCSDAFKQIERFKMYLAKNPKVVVVDPIENVMKLFDRMQQYDLVQQLFKADDETHCFTPQFVQLNSKNMDENKTALQTNRVQFPIVCKPMISHGSSLCHEMSIIFNESGLNDIEVPCVAQTFVNHNAKLFKIFVVGDQHFIVERPSVKNLKAGDYATIFFNSNNVSKPNASSFLTEVIESELELPIIEPDVTKLRQLSSSVQKSFELDLLGIDVIIENKTGRYAIIDINTFPGYEDVPNFLDVLLDFIHRKLRESRSSCT
jgi:inositol-1,3,4-trisphosphate 5/6-kinase/inositol-tetrakisphosphate 1-kinase